MPEPANQPNAQPISHDWWYAFRTAKLIAAHIICFTIALFLSFIVYRDMRLGDWVTTVFLAWLIPTLLVKLIVFGFLRQYQGWWRYASTTDILSIIKGSHISALILVLGWYALMWYAANYSPALTAPPRPLTPSPPSRHAHGLGRHHCRPLRSTPGHQAIL